MYRYLAKTKILVWLIFYIIQMRFIFGFFCVTTYVYEIVINEFDMSLSFVIRVIFFDLNDNGRLCFFLFLLKISLIVFHVQFITVRIGVKSWVIVLTFS